MKVCVADDHDAVREALAELLTSGFDMIDVVQARTGEEAIEAARSGAVDIVLMDVNMPGIDGVTATRRIREAHPQVRVVALTAANDPESIAAMIAAGADSYLVKTISPDELRESLRRIFRGGVVLAPEVLPVVVEDLARRLRTEHDRAEALAALDRMKREFISLVSDQLRNPLTGISGYVKTLLNRWEAVDEDLKREFLERIDEQTTQLERRIQQILTVARLEAERVRGAVPFSLDAAVREVLERLGPRLASRDVIVDLAPVEVVADRRAITEATLALVDNALVHTTGSVGVRLRASETEAVVEVEDEGPGLEGELLAARLAEPFLPGDASDTREATGMGLSLYIAGRMVDNSSGRLEFETGPDRGTVARLRLPLRAGA